MKKHINYSAAVMALYGQLFEKDLPTNNMRRATKSRTPASRGSVNLRDPSYQPKPPKPKRKKRKKRK